MVRDSWWPQGIRFIAPEPKGNRNFSMAEGDDESCTGAIS